MQTRLSQALIPRISMQLGVHLNLAQIDMESSDKCLSGGRQDPTSMGFGILPLYRFWVTSTQK